MEFLVYGVIGVMVFAFFVACILPGSIVRNFRNLLRVYAVIVIALIGLGIWVFFANQQKTIRQRQQNVVPNPLPKQAALNPLQALEKQPAEKEAREQKEKARIENEKADLEEMLAKKQQAEVVERQSKENETEQKKWREWTIDGRLVKAKFVKYIGGVAYLELENGRQVKGENLTPEEKGWINSRPWNQ